ncbi:hypothetical protein [Mycolicibacterium litorale]|uniref:hypothetical protein n=1 Tax=Mycolicibacterium litorale TaxID=758802 RepID=UPI001E31D8FE|nr:hypothetical protein [Mycolicibacterium litorale]
MPITLINPDGLPTVDLYKQVAVATGSKLVFISAKSRATPTATRASEKLGVTALPQLTGIDVATLAEPDMLIEVEATAVLDRSDVARLSLIAGHKAHASPKRRLRRM